MKYLLLSFCLLSAYVAGQRITTIQLDGVQYFVSRMNPYSPELNYYLAYQYCRSLGLQLASFETKEKAESMTQYLRNAGFSKYDFWTSGNRLGTGMFLWMSTGLPFNATFEYFENKLQESSESAELNPNDHNSNTAPQRTARGTASGIGKGCVVLKAPSLKWAPEDCATIKDFICEQTRCYYYNYGSIPVSSAQGRPILTSSTTATTSTTTTQLPPILIPSPSPKTLTKDQPLVRSFPSGSPTNELNQNEDNKSAPTTTSTSTSTSTTTTTTEASSQAQISTTEEVSEDLIKTESPFEEQPADYEQSTENDEPLEKHLKQISEVVEKFNNMDTNERDIGRQSFFSLSDLIKTLNPIDAKKVQPQIDSSYSNTMRVLGEQMFDESRKLNNNNENQNFDETDPTTL